MHPKIDFILTVYNTNINNVKKSILSIENNIDCPYKIILVDDGSNLSKSMAYKKLTEEYKNVKYVYKHNGGVSSARNLGIRIAKSNYISFIDSDDVLCNSIAFPKIDKDIIVYDMCVNGKTEQTIKNFRGNITPKVFFESVIKDPILNSACGKLFSRSFIQEHDIFFNEKIVHGEDLDFLISCLSYDPQMYYVNTTVYDYLYDYRSTLNRAKNNAKTMLLNYGSLYVKEEKLIETLHINKSEFLTILKLNVLKDIFNLCLSNTKSNNDLLETASNILKNYNIYVNKNIIAVVRYYLVVLKCKNILFIISILRKGYLSVK